MKVLLDENLPHDLRHFLPGHAVFTVAYLGWQGVENGALLAKAAELGFDVVVTLDAGFEYQRNLAALAMSVIIIHARSSAMDDLRPLVPNLLMAINTITPLSLVRVGERPR